MTPTHPSDYRLGKCRDVVGEQADDADEHPEDD